MPAVIFLGLAGGGEASRGWGVPMATDIAFALGVLAILGSRVPLGLRVFLTALAIADDLLAVLVIAVFYTSDLSLPALAAAGAMLALVAANVLGVRRPLAWASGHRSAGLPCSSRAFMAPWSSTIRPVEDAPRPRCVRGPRPRHHR